MLPPGPRPVSGGLSVGLGLLLLAGCALLPTGRVPTGGYPPDTILRLPDRTPVSLDTLLQALAPTRVIYVGEHHVNPHHHRLQRQILEGLATRGPVALGMEMFARSAQPALDAWVAGRLGEEAFLRAADWEEQWGMDFALYRGLLQVAREQRLPVLALNAPRETVRAVARIGLEQLLPEARAALAAEIGPASTAYRARLEAAYAEHRGQASGGLAEFVEAQLAWDETMAEGVAAFLARPEAAGTWLVVVAGAEHVAFAHGIPARAARRLPHRYAIVLAVGQGEEVPLGAADFAWVTAANPEPPRVPSLGLILARPEGSGPGLRILWVDPEGAAGRAGVQGEDRLLALDGKRVESPAEVRAALRGKGPDGSATLTLLRGGEEREVTARFGEIGAGKPGAPGGEAPALPDRPGTR